MMYTMPKNLLSICVNFALATQHTNDNFACKKVLQAGYGLQDLNAFFTFRAVHASDRS